VHCVTSRQTHRNAAAVILAHPSGVAEPSQADELITRRLKEALSLVDIGVLDHIIVAGGDTTSMAERGLADVPLMWSSLLALRPARSLEEQSEQRPLAHRAVNFLQYEI